MGAARRLGHDLVHDPEALEVGGRDLHGDGRFLGARGVAPQDGGAALGRDDRVDGVLQHVDPVPHRHGQRAAAAPFAGDVDHDGHAQRGHAPKVEGDGLGLAPLLGVEPGISAGSVHEGHDGPRELGRQLHHAQGLAVPLRLGHPEVAVDLLLGVAALLVAQDCDRPVLVEGEPTDERGVVAVAAVAVDLGELGEEGLDEVQGIGPIGVAGHQRLLPGGEPRVDAAPLAVQLQAELGGLRGAGGVGLVHELVDTLLQVDERGLEVGLSRHRRSCAPAPASPGPAGPPPRRGRRRRDAP